MFFYLFSAGDEFIFTKTSTLPITPLLFFKQVTQIHHIIHNLIQQQ